MKNYNDFINAKIINKNKEEGIVTSFDKDHIVIAYQTGEKTYNPEIAIKNGFLLFVDEGLNTLYQQELNEKNEAQKQYEELVKKIDENRPIKMKRARALHKKYLKKLDIIRSLFGGDFVYPPYEKFMKEYKDILKVEPKNIFVIPERWNHNYMYR